MNNSQNEYEFKGVEELTFNELEWVGHYVLGGDSNYNTKIGLVKKPFWLHRTMMKLLLGITWEDKK
jgi:hypothetical protein